MFGNVKQEEFWNTKETGHLLEDDIKVSDEISTQRILSTFTFIH